MRYSVRIQSTVHPRRGRLATVTAILVGVLLSACGGTSGSPTATPAAGTTSSGRTAARVAPSTTRTSTPRITGSGPLAFANCMRANGLPNFPDPNPSGGFDISSAAGVNPSSQGFQAAQAKCQKYMRLPGGVGGPLPPANPQSLTKLRKIAVCMRAHGISEFPDPSQTPPVNALSSGISVITDFDGAFLAFPRTLNLEAPAYRQALAACGAPPLGLPH